MKEPSSPCPDCQDLTRRDMLRYTGGALAATALGASGIRGQDAAAQRPATSETLVAQLYGSLSPKLRQEMVFPFDHPLRRKVDNNWTITRVSVGRHFSPDQQALIRQIFDGLHSEEYRAKVRHQVEHDHGRRGFGACSVAIFGQPGSGKFEFVLSGRHVTRRCDGDSVAGTAFGGPIFYGHAARSFNEAADHPDNVYWFQAVRANEVFQALDGKQRERALRRDPRPERGTRTVQLTGRKTGLPGIPMSELTADQKDLVRRTMGDLLAPFRQRDVDETMKLVEASGFDHLHLAFYANMDIGNDRVWDVWQIEGPDMLWYFRGAPHVHTWVHVRAPRGSKPRRRV